MVLSIGNLFTGTLSVAKNRLFLLSLLLRSLFACSLLQSDRRAARKRLAGAPRSLR